MDDQSSRPSKLILELGLLPHPEGGYFGDVHVSSHRVTPQDDRSDRPAITAIYFLLADGQHSKWHVLRSDEVWHHYEGDPLELLVVDPVSLSLTVLILGSMGDGGQPVHVVPAGCWQAARTMGEYTLVGCTVGPGFVFEDFQLLRHNKKAALRLRNAFEAYAEML